jgi:hypothetical protein
VTSSSPAFRARPDVRFRVVDGKGVLIRQEAGEVVVLNPVGARVLDLLQSGAVLQRVLERLAEEFEVGAAELERDVLQFVRELVDAGVLEEEAR